MEGGIVMGCNEGHGHRRRHHRHHGCDCGDSCECEGGSCECGCGNSGFRRRYPTKAEQIAELEEYLSQLKTEVQAVEEHLADLRK
jgi:hypothetical protein